MGVGKTLEIGSRELHFTTQHPLKAGEKVQLAVNWPAMLDKTCLMKLELFGWVLGSEAGVSTVKIERYEFRTRAAPVALMTA